MSEHINQPSGNDPNGNNPLSELEREIADLQRQKDEIIQKNKLIAKRDSLQKELTFGLKSEGQNEAPAEPANVRRYDIAALPAAENESRALIENGIRAMYAHRKDLWANKREIDKLVEVHLSYYDAYAIERQGKRMSGVFTSEAKGHALMSYIKSKNNAGANYLPFFSNIKVFQ